MDQTRAASPVYPRKWSSESSTTTTSLSPARYHHSLSSSTTGISNIKRTQNVAAKAAAQRLAQVMASRATDIDAAAAADDLDFRFAPTFINRRPPVNANKVATTNAATTRTRPSIPYATNNYKITGSPSPAVTL
ncbi:hypothetical protein L6452_00003 [Arctium lappa]|uniref:Uncharacterized protein n=1 Tax=Arctium lappa TaxID=4217 RepID=A0ACB9FCX5_ARCLA|nr:hypothetical protein L6452_00003 [Arctium lappa]